MVTKCVQRTLHHVHSINIYITVYIDILQYIAENIMSELKMANDTSPV